MNFAAVREEARAAQRQAVVDALADHQEQIGLAKCRVDGVVQRRVGVAHHQRMVVGDRRRAPW